MSASDPANPTPPPQSNAAWGGRFDRGPAEIMETINASIGFDHRLYAEDIAGSKAHCRMLVEQGILTQADGFAIETGLDRVAVEIAEGTLVFKTERDAGRPDDPDCLAFELSGACGAGGGGRRYRDAAAWLCGVDDLMPNVTPTDTQRRTSSLRPATQSSRNLALTEANRPGGMKP